MREPGDSSGNKSRGKQDSSVDITISDKNEAEISDEQEIVKLWRQMDEKLEDRAKAHNMTAINVKSLLHHLIKNPEMISKVMGIDEEPDLPNLKLTRSKVKHLRRSTELSPIPTETDVVAVPRVKRTFLDVDYGQDEDEDDDYKPEQAAEGNQEEEEDEIENICGDVADDVEEELLKIGEDTEAVAQQDTFLKDDRVIVRTRSRTRNPELDFLDDNTLAPENDVLLYSAVDDPDYMAFISTLNDPELRFDFDEKDDPEYDFMADEIEDETEKDELRMDRATEIPMREVEDLFEDLLAPHVSVPLTSYGVEVSNAGTFEAKACEAEVTSKPQSSSRNEKFNFPKFTDHITALIDTTPEVLEKTGNSASLIGASKENPPFFKDFEREQLRAQLMKHVQLLTQFVVGCQFEPELESARNSYQEMINSLYDLREKAQETSMFHISNLDGCVVSCHDARSFDNKSLTTFAAEKAPAIRPETMVVLSRSEAVVFPDLVPEVRLQDTSTYYRYFTVQEEHLLALGVNEFSHVPHNQYQRPVGRNSLIARHYLPTKTTSQIKNHMKNFRSSPELIYTLIARAEQGKVTLVFPPESCENAQTKPPFLWNPEIWPQWLKTHQKEIFYAINGPEVSFTGIQSSSSEANLTQLCIISGNYQNDSSSSFQSVPQNGQSNISESATNTLFLLLQAPSNTEVTFLPVSVPNLSVLGANNNILPNMRCTGSSFSTLPTATVQRTNEMSNLASSPEVITISDNDDYSPAVKQSELATLAKKFVSRTKCSFELNDSKRTEVTGNEGEVESQISQTKLHGNSTRVIKGKEHQDRNVANLLKELEISDSDTSATEVFPDRSFASEPDSKSAKGVPVSKNSIVVENVAVECWAEAKEDDCKKGKQASVHCLDEIVLSSSDNDSFNKSANDSDNPDENGDITALPKNLCVIRSVEDASGIGTSVHEEKDLNIVGNEVEVNETDFHTAISRNSDRDINAYVSKKGELGTNESCDHSEDWSNSSDVNKQHEFIFPVTFSKKSTRTFEKETKSSNNEMTPLVTPRLRYPSSSFGENDDLSHISCETSHLEQTEWSRDDYVPKTPGLFTVSKDENSNSKQLIESVFSKKGAKNLFGTSLKGSTTFEHYAFGSVDCKDPSAKIVENLSMDDDNLIITDAAEQISFDDGAFGVRDSDLTLVNEEPRDLDSVEDDLENDIQPCCSKEKDDERSSDDEKRRNIVKRGKKRKRRDRLMTGLKGMLDRSHREKQFKALSKVILGDFKQQMFMHQDKIRAVQTLINSEKPSPGMFEKLYEILAPEHSLLLILLSLIFPEAELPESAIRSPLRKAFFAAIEMILNIEAYTSFGKTKYSARSIFRCIRQLGPFCDCDDLEKRLSELISNEDPLWCALSANFPATKCTPSTRIGDYEFVDMEAREESQFEYEDVDLSAALGPGGKRRQTSARIINGRLLIEKNGKLCEAIAYIENEEKQISGLSYRPSIASSLNSEVLSQPPKLKCAIHNNQDPNSLIIGPSRSRKSNTSFQLKKLESNEQPGLNTIHLKKDGERKIAVNVSYSPKNDVISKKSPLVNSELNDVSSSPVSIISKDGSAAFIVPSTSAEIKIQSDRSVGSPISSEQKCQLVGAEKETVVSGNSAQSDDVTAEMLENEQRCSSLKWSRLNDKTLLYSYNDCSGNVEKTVKLAGERLGLNNAKAIEERLLYLLSLFK